MLTALIHHDRVLAQIYAARQALERAITDAALWERLRKKCGTVARENTISANAQKIRSVWEIISKGLSQREETQEVGA